MRLNRAFLISLLLAPGLALAQSTAPLKLIVGFPPGTGPDVVARLLAQKVGPAGSRRSASAGHCFAPGPGPGPAAAK